MNVECPRCGLEWQELDDEIEQLRDDNEKLCEALEEITELAPAGRIWGLARAALEPSLKEASDE